ncbi:MAG: histidine phosphatase family protein [Aestuariivirga sp.]
MTAVQNKPLNLYLIRHGQTEWSLSDQHTGSTDIALTSHEEAEARALEPWIAQIQFSRVFNSPLQRAKRTCALVGLSQAAEIEPDLAEWDYGDYESKTSADIRKDRPEWNVFQDGCPGGELPAQVCDRADRLIAHLCTMNGNVALFSHGHFGSALAARWIEQPLVEAEHLLLSTASLSILSYNPAHREVRVIALWNSTPRQFATTA